MASSLSEEEFVRMQTQLLELRGTNYQLDDKCKSQERELLVLRDQVAVLDRDLQKANRSLNKSKKAKEFELLLQENESLQQKLFSQEEEFRLQNETLMQELGQVVKVNENLERENAELKDGCGGDSSRHDAESTALQDDVRRLQAQNSALQMNLSTCQKGHDVELMTLRQNITDLEAQCLKLSGERGSPEGTGSSESRTVEGQSDPEPAHEDLVDDPNIEASDSRHSGEQTTDPLDSSISSGNTSLVNKSSIQSQLEDHTQLLTDLRLSFDTEREENKLLKTQLKDVEKSYKEQVKSLQEELEKLQEKYKKKQESLVQLQNEKETLYTELSKKVETTQEERDREVEACHQQSGSLQQDLTKYRQALEEHETKAKQRIQDLQDVVQNLESQVNETTAENSAYVTQQNLQIQQQQMSFQQQLDTVRRQKEDLLSQLQESHEAHQRAEGELLATQQDRDHQIQATQEAHRVAEKRKSLLDELAIKYQEECDARREQVKKMEQQHAAEVQELEEAHKAEANELNQRISSLKVKANELDGVKEEVVQLRTQVSGLEEAKGWLERRLAETEDSLKEAKERHEAEIVALGETHRKEVDKVKDELGEQILSLEQAVEGVKQEKVDQEAANDKLRQEIKDGVEGKKIHEKKGLTMLKDLKRQLQQERRRADKLQERLQEYLQSDNRSRQSVEELFRPADPNDRYRGDNSSISSWSASGYSRDIAMMPSPEEEAPSGVLEHENTDLLKRLAGLQQEKWTLDERVSHLESSNSCMAEDLLQKTAIIEHYVMESRMTQTAQSPSQEKISLKHVMDFVKNKSDENQRDMNKKLQHMLEETLTKNMHLQQDLETLSQEVVRLSKNVTESPQRVPSAPDVST